MTEQHCKRYFSWKRQGISVQWWTDMSCMLSVQLRINQQFNIHQESCSWSKTPEKPSRSFRSQKNVEECLLPPNTGRRKSKWRTSNLHPQWPRGLQRSPSKSFSSYNVQNLFSDAEENLLNTENPSTLLRLFIPAMSKEKLPNIYFQAKNHPTRPSLCHWWMLIA